MLQIIIGVVRGLHYGKVDIRAGNRKPTDHIRILQIQLAVFRKHGFFLREQNIGSFTFACLRLFHNLGNFFKDFFLLAFVRIVAVNTEAAKSRRT